MNDEKQPLSQEELRVAQFIAEAFTGIANMILQAENPAVVFAMVMDAIGNETEHIALCDECDNSEICAKMEVTPEQYRQLALEFNTKLQKMMGFIPDVPSDKHLH